jgi:acyl-coenzyme A thioesterase PaaI-like protein
VPAIASAYERIPQMLTVTMTIDYLGGLYAEDAIAEGWVEKRGKRTVFCRVEVRSPAGELVTRASLVYNVRPMS